MLKAKTTKETAHLIGEPFTGELPHDVCTVGNGDRITIPADAPILVLSEWDCGFYECYFQADQIFLWRDEFQLIDPL